MNQIEIIVQGNVNMMININNDTRINSIIKNQNI